MPAQTLGMQGILPVEQGWQPIATAPKTVREVLVWNGSDIWISGRTEGRKGSDGMPTTGADWFIGVYRYYPTHWMPLPPPPALTTP
jgi:hypothetical protein